MRTTAALVCAIISVAAGLLFVSWLNSRKGTGRDNARVFAVVKGRMSNFRSFQYLPVIASVVVVSAALGLGLGWKQAAACFAGAVLSLVVLTAGSVSYSGGITAAYNEAMNGDIRQSVRAGYRTGAAFGSIMAGIILAVFCILILTLKTRIMITYSASFALGAAVVSMILHTGGEVYTSAYSLAVPSGDFTDRTGSFAAAGSDYSGSYIIAAASAAILADLGVATSGVTSTFTAGSAARFPVMVYAAGLAGSVIGYFIQRTGTGSDLSKGFGAGCITSGIITAAASVYLSMTMLQSRVYAWAVTAGIIAALVLSSVSRLFASDSRLFINGYKTDRNLGRHSSVIFSMGTGMMSTAVDTVAVLAAIAVSYMFASYYGVALCAVGMISMLGSFEAVTGMVSAAGTVSDIIDSEKTPDNEEASKAATGLLDTVSGRNLASVKSYAGVSGLMAAVSAFCALFYTSGSESIDLMSLRVFAGIAVGVCSAFLLSGMLVGSVRITGRVALRDIGKNDDDTGATSALRGAVLPAVVAIAFPTAVGLLIGAKALAGFLIASIITGYMLITCFAKSGMHFENTAIQSLSSLLKMMAVFSIAFLPVFIRVGGFLFQ